MFLKFSNYKLFKLFMEMSMGYAFRVLVPGGRLVLLTSQHLSTRIAEIFENCQDSNKKQDTFVSEPHEAYDQKDSVIGVRTFHKMTAGTSGVDWGNQNLDSVKFWSNTSDSESQMIPSAGSLVPHLFQDHTTIEQLGKCLMRFSLFAKHYVKLGETHGSIMVFQKQKYRVE